MSNLAKTDLTICNSILFGLVRWSENKLWLKYYLAVPQRRSIPLCCAAFLQLLQYLEVFEVKIFKLSSVLNNYSPSAKQDIKHFPLGSFNGVMKEI